MKKHALGLFLFAGCIAFGASGCAKSEMVKKDEPIATSSAATEPAKALPAPEQAAKPAPVKIEPVSEQPITPPAKAQEAAQASQARDLRASLEKVFFDFDSATLSKDARDKLSRDAEIMKKDHDVKVQIEGHCDERGSDEYNLALGEKRARAAMHYLTSMGIPADHLSVISYGKEKPADTGHDQAAWAQNRRDEFVVPNN